MINNILKNIIFIPILSVILINSNLKAEETEDLTVTLEQNLTELEELETIQNDQEKTQQNKSQYFKGLNLNKETLLQNDDKKEIIPSKAAKISEKADLIFNLIKDARKDYNKITEGNKETEGPDQNGMKDLFDKIVQIAFDNDKPLSDDQNAKYRQFLYLSLNWDKNLLEKFRKKLQVTIKISLIKTARNIAILGINIQTNSEEALKTIFLNSQTKKNLYKIETKDLEKIKNNVNKIMNLRKEWQDLVNNDDDTSFFYENTYKKVNEIKNIKQEIQRILK